MKKGMEVTPNQRVLAVLSPSVLAFFLTLLIAGYVLYAEPRIGLADNGDFYRIMASNGIMHLPSRSPDDFFSYYNSDYSVMQYYNPYSNSFKSTQSIVIQIALFLDGFLTKDPVFHIEFLSAQLLLVLAFGIAILVDEVYPFFRATWIQYLSAVLAVVVLADTGYTAYFNSFYGESVAYPFFVLSIASLIKLAKGKGPTPFLWLSLFTLSTLMFVGAKNQFAASGAVAALVLVLFVPLIFSGRRGYTALVLFCAGCLLVGSVYYFRQIDDRIFLINKYHAISRGVILHQPKADEKLLALGIDPKFEMLRGTIYFDYTPPIHPLDARLKHDFYAHYDLVKLTKWYLGHPDDLKRILIEGGKNSFFIRPDVLGNYERVSGKKEAQRSDTFTMWSAFKERALPHKFRFLVFCTLLGIALCALRFYQKRLLMDVGSRLAAETVWLYVVAIGLSQILVAIIGAGDADLRKHLFLVNVTFDLMVYYNVMYLLSEFNPGTRY